MLHRPHHNDICTVLRGKFTNTENRRTLDEMPTFRWHSVAFGQGRKRLVLSRSQGLINPGGQG
ncbi:hypothetical protein D3C76_1813950 [compost metagenome]